MTKVTVDPTLRSKLHNLEGQVELCDESGRTLGHFLPEEFYKELLVAWSRTLITDEELERRIKEPGGRPLAEIWKRLGRT